MKHFYDLDDGEYGFQLSDSLLMNQDGDLMQKLSDHLAIDLDSGDIHLILSHNNNPDEE